MFVLGAGLCPHQPMMLSAMLRHGKLEVHELGYYTASYNMGTTVGMWLPGVCQLHRIETTCVICELLLVSICVKHFPWYGTLEQESSAPPLSSPAPLNDTVPERIPVLTPYTLR